MNTPLAKTRTQPGTLLCCFVALLLPVINCLGDTLDQARLSWYQFNETSGTSAANHLGSAGNGTLEHGMDIAENGDDPDTFIVTVPQGAAPAEFARLRAVTKP